jgi:ribosome biogenesis protein BRX1
MLRETPTLPESAFNADEDKAFKTKIAVDWVNKQRTLVIFSKGIRNNERQLAKDLVSLMCHSKTDSTLDKSGIFEQISELCKLKSCQNCIFFEQKKHELFLWIAKYPEGPSVKFRLSEIVLAESNKFHGNCLKGSRPILSFDAEFLKTPEHVLLKNLLVDAFNIPNNHPKSQPFFDKVFAFNIHNKAIHFRNYQVAKNGNKVSDIEFTEIGPRFQLELVKIFDGFFGGSVIYYNQEFKELRDKKMDKYLNIKKELDAKKKKKIRKSKKMEAYGEKGKPTVHDELLD